MVILHWKQTWLVMWVKLIFYSVSKTLNAKGVFSLFCYVVSDSWYMLFFNQTTIKRQHSKWWLVQACNHSVYTDWHKVFKSYSILIQQESPHIQTLQTGFGKLSVLPLINPSSYSTINITNREFIWIVFLRPYLGVLNSGQS